MMVIKGGLVRGRFSVAAPEILLGDYNVCYNVIHALKVMNKKRYKNDSNIALLKIKLKRAYKFTS